MVRVKNILGDDVYGLWHVKKIVDNKDGQLEDGILSTATAIDLPPIEPLCLSYGQNDEWSLPIETVASAFSCHE